MAERDADAPTLKRQGLYPCEGEIARRLSQSEKHWRRIAPFLACITAGNEGLAAFLQRIAGYSLTGITREHAMFFGYGTGGNGKGVFLNTLTRIYGSYADVAPAETFLVRSDRHPTGVAGLRGARFVTAQEIEDGQQWAEAKIKALTGDDPISARCMRQDFFTFEPEFKLFVALTGRS